MNKHEAWFAEFEKKMQQREKIENDQFEGF